MNATFLKYFDSILDPRIERCKKYNLLDILLLAITAVMSGSERSEDIENSGIYNLISFVNTDLYVAGMPRHDTIARVICRFKNDEIEQAFKRGYFLL